MRIVLREIANRDIEAAFDHYFVEAGGVIAEAFLDQLSHTLKHICDFPEAGSPKYQHLFPEIDVRFWLLKRYPFVIFYVVTAEFVDVIGLLHKHSDIPAHLLDHFHEDESD